MKLMDYAVISTWVFAGLGFFINPAFFLVGMLMFLIVASYWTVRALYEGMGVLNVIGAWAIPVLMVMFLGFAVMLSLIHI